jgi:WD40 repeat protein
MDRPESFERIAEYGGAILGFSVAPDRKHFASGGLDRNLIVWEINKTTSSRSTQLDDWATAVSYCRDGRSIAVGLANGVVEVRSASTSSRETSWTAHKGRVVAAVASGEKLVTIGDDAMSVVWNLDGKRLLAFDEKAPCRAIAIHGDQVAIGKADGGVSVYDLSNGSVVQRLEGRPLSVTALAYSRDGSTLLVGSFDGYIESFDTKSWKIARSNPGDGNSVLSMDANPTNDLIVAGYRHGVTRILDVGSLKTGPTVQLDPAREIFVVHWIINSHSFAAAGASNGIHFYKLEGDMAAWSASVR